MNKEIKSVDYDVLGCWGEEDAVCPYCGCENYIEPEDYLSQDEEDIIECYACEKNFVYRIDYKVTFTSEPLENYYLTSKEQKLRLINHIKDRIKNGNDDNEYLNYQLEHHKKQLEDLDQDVLMLLEEEE